MVGSPRAVHKAEAERNQGLRQLQEQVKASDARQHSEAAITVKMQKMRDDLALGQAKAAIDARQAQTDAVHKVDSMDVERLRDFESQQYSAMANLDAEIRDLAAKEHELQLGENLDDAKKRAVQAGVTRVDASAEQADNGALSRKQRQERLLAEHSSRQEIIKRQKEHLLAERSNIESDLRSLKANQIAGLAYDLQHTCTCVCVRSDLCNPVSESTAMVARPVTVAGSVSMIIACDHTFRCISMCAALQVLFNTRGSFAMA